jgi:hypothetical protein
MLVPPELFPHISRHSGMFLTTSRYYGKPLRALFRLPENRRFLYGKLLATLTPEFIYPYAENPQVILQMVNAKKNDIWQLLPEMIESQVIPYFNDLLFVNPVIQLHELNKNFLRTSAITLTQDIHVLDADYFNRNPETRSVEYAENDFGPNSYSDGTWHPEHLFTNTARNRANPYWTPLEVTYDNEGTRGPGHRYNDPDIYSGNKFPHWQAFKSYVDYKNTETLREGGHSDRRTQTPYGYDMSRLRAKSSY